MDGAGRVSRRRFAVSGVAAVTLAVAGCDRRERTAPRPAPSTTRPTASPAASADAGRPGRVAYCNVLHDGEWTGPRDAGGRPALSLIDAILAGRDGCARPQYLRMTSASSSGTQVPGQGTEELTAVRRLTGGGIRLGVAVNTAPPAGRRSVDDILAQARQIRTASEDSGGIYDWIFLDNAVNRTPAGDRGLNDLQRIVDGVTAAGWPRIMINATGFTPRDFPSLPRGIWAMARHLGLLDGEWQAAARTAIDTGTGALTSGDEQFIDYVNQHRTGSTAVLKLEISSQTDRFRVLGRDDQAALLRLWAQAGPQRGYRIIYPLFVPGQQPLGNQTNQYDSLTVGTFWDQRALMERYG